MFSLQYFVLLLKSFQFELFNNYFYSMNEECKKDLLVEGEQGGGGIYLEGTFLMENGRKLHMLLYTS